MWIVCVCVCMCIWSIVKIGNMNNTLDWFGMKSCRCVFVYGFACSICMCFWDIVTLFCHFILTLSIECRRVRTLWTTNNIHCKRALSATSVDQIHFWFYEFVVCCVMFFTFFSFRHFRPWILKFFSIFKRRIIWMRYFCYTCRLPNWLVWTGPR